MDDIDYLLKNSEKDSSLLVIDSSARDKNKFPSPSEYTLEFSQPFRFVFGFDIIDATIPSTMYVVDEHNNVLCFNVFTFVHESITLPELYNTFTQFVSDEFYRIYKKQETPLIQFAFFDKYALDITSFAIADGGSQYYFANQDTVVAVTWDIFERFSTTRGVMVLNCYRYEIELGNYNVGTFQTYFKKNLRQFNIDIRSPTSDLSVEKQMKYKFVNYNIDSGISQPFFIDIDKSTCGTCIGFDLLPSAKDDTYIDVPSFKRFGSRCVFGSIAKMEYDVMTHSIVSPGIVYLLGVRYVTLRCPEIEGHLNGSISYGTKHNVGLGIFKMHSPYEVSNLKFDFLNFVKKPFHPIGKLNKITIRFEREEGVLYNFRGLNHHIIVVVKYYVPSMSINKKDPVHILNPNYNPNFLDYMVEREEILNDDEDDDEEYEDEDDHDMLKRYVFMKNQRS